MLMPKCLKKGQCMEEYREDQMTFWPSMSGTSTYTTNIFFDICRGFQGIGNAFMLPNAIVLLTNKYNSNTAAGIRRRVIVLTVFGACGSSGNVIGLVFAALLGQFSQWAWTGLTTR
jgi:MFS family permease